MTDSIVLGAVGDVALLEPPRADLFRQGWDDADLRIANLEAPLTDGGVPAAKLIRLKAPTEAAGWVKDLGCHAVALANNHVMDWGELGLRSTLECLDAAGIQHAGAGLTLEQARGYRLLKSRAFTVAFLSWACTVPPGFDALEDRPGLAALRIRSSYAVDTALVDEQPGTPPWVETQPWEEDVAHLKDVVKAARSEANFVVLALHWGVPPQWQSRFQGPLAEYQDAMIPHFAEAGVDLVLGHHAHTVYGLQAVGRPDGGRTLICFSLGNYVFHPLARPKGLRWNPSAHPYHAPELPENSETYVATFRLGRRGDGAAGVLEARLYPSVLDETWEARCPTPEQAERIVTRVRAFSDWRMTPTTVEDGNVVWRAS